MKMVLLTAAALACILGASVPQARGDSVTLNGGGTSEVTSIVTSLAGMYDQYYSYVTGYPPNSMYFEPDVLPFEAFPYATVGSEQAHAGCTLSPSSFWVSYGLYQDGGGTLNGTTYRGYVMTSTDIYFSVSQATNYQAEGYIANFPVSGPSQSNIQLKAKLYDITTQTPVLMSDQNGDIDKVSLLALARDPGLIGLLTGTLKAGDQYEWVTEAITQGYGGVGAASVGGDFNLALTPTSAPVPLPKSGLLGLSSLLGLAGLGLARRYLSGRRMFA